MHGEQPAADEVGLHRLAQAQRHVRLPHAEVEFLVRQQQLQLHLRIELDEFAEARREPVGAETEGRRDPEFAGRLLAAVDQPAAHRVELEDDVPHRAEQHFALFGEDQAARVAMEQRRAEVGFERADLPADRRLAQAQRFAGVGERAGVGGRLENAQLVPVHDVSPGPCRLRSPLVRVTRGARAVTRSRVRAYSAASCRVGACAASQRSASSAAMQPSPAAVTACRKTSSATSPAANTPSTLVAVEPGAVWT